MANIPKSAFYDWKDGDVVTAYKYNQENELVRIANNDNDERIVYIENLIKNGQLGGGGQGNEVFIGSQEPLGQFKIWYDTSSGILKIRDQFSKWVSFNGQDTRIGDLNSLNTSAKNNVTSALNEVNSKVGNTAQLQTSAKNDLVSALNELFQLANNGKSQLASVIGTPAQASDTFTQLQAKLQTIKQTLVDNLVVKGINVTIGMSFQDLIALIPAIMGDQSQMALKFNLGDIIAFDSISKAFPFRLPVDTLSYTGTGIVTGGSIPPLFVNKRVLIICDNLSDQYSSAVAGVVLNLGYAVLQSTLFDSDLSNKITKADLIILCNATNLFKSYPNLVTLIKTSNKPLLFGADDVKFYPTNTAYKTFGLSTIDAVNEYIGNVKSSSSQSITGNISTGGDVSVLNLAYPVITCVNGTLIGTPLLYTDSIAVVTPTDLLEDFENGISNTLTWTFTGGTWGSSAIGKGRFGGRALTNPTILDSQTTKMTTTVFSVSPVTIAFDYMASSESPDYFKFIVNGVEEVKTSGTSNSYANFSKTYPTGTYTITFQYSKDVSASKGDDCGYVDNLIIRGNFGVTTSVNRVGASIISENTLLANSTTYPKKIAVFGYLNAIQLTTNGKTIVQNLLNWLLS